MDHIIAYTIGKCYRETSSFYLLEWICASSATTTVTVVVVVVLFICLSVCLWLSVCLSVCLSLSPLSFYRLYHMSSLSPVRSLPLPGFTPLFRLSSRFNVSSNSYLPVSLSPASLRSRQYPPSLRVFHLSRLPLSPVSHVSSVFPVFPVFPTFPVSDTRLI